MCITKARCPLRGRQSGLSLVELVIAIVVLSIGVVALLIPIATATRGSGDPLVSKQMVAVAESMLEEIELQPFVGSFGGPYTPATRAQFDAVPDYDGFATNGIFTVDNTAIGGLGSYNILVSAKLTALCGVPAGQAYLIAVAVTGSNGSTVTLSACRTSYF